MSTLAKIHFDYGIKFDIENQKKVKELAFESNFTLDDNPISIWNPFIMLIEDAAQFGKFSVEKILPNRILDSITLIKQKNEGLLNEKCNVHVGGLGTLAIDTVEAQV